MFLQALLKYSIGGMTFSGLQVHFRDNSAGLYVISMKFLDFLSTFISAPPAKDNQENSKIAVAVLITLSCSLLVIALFGDPTPLYYMQLNIIKTCLVYVRQDLQYSYNPIAY